MRLTSRGLDAVPGTSGPLGDGAAVAQAVARRAIAASATRRASFAGDDTRGSLERILARHVPRAASPDAPTGTWAAIRLTRSGVHGTVRRPSTRLTQPRPQLRG